MRTASVSRNVACAPGRTRFEQLARRRRAPRASAHRARLLVDLLEHVVRGNRPSRPRPPTARSRASGALDGLPLASRIATPSRRISATSPSSRNMNRRVTGSSAATSDATKFSFVAEADHDRAARAREHDAVGVFLRHHRERVRAFELRDRRAHGLEQVARCLQVIVDAVRDDFGVGLGRELVAGLQLVAQLLVVLDDAVVHERDAVARDVRMGVALARHAVRGPARVRDAEVPVRRVDRRGRPAASAPCRPCAAA